MIVLSIIYPCNFGCPNCPYTDGNSRSGASTTSAGGPVPRPAVAEDRRRVRGVRRLDALHGRGRADAASAHGGHDRVRQGQGRPGLAEHERQHVRPIPKLRGKLERILRAGIDLIEFSMDAGDAETYAKVRPPHGGPPRRDPEPVVAGSGRQRAGGLDLRRELRAPTCRWWSRSSGRPPSRGVWTRPWTSGSRRSASTR